MSHGSYLSALPQLTLALVVDSETVGDESGIERYL